MNTFVILSLFAGIAGTIAAVLGYYSSQLRKKNKELEQQNSSITIQKEHLTAQMDVIQKANEVREQELKEQISSQYAMHDQIVQDLRADFEKQKEEIKSQSRAALEMAREQIINETQKVLKDRITELSDANKEQVGALCDPLKLNMDELRKAIDMAKETANKNAGEFAAKMEELSKSSKNLGEEAGRLTKTLTTNKTQGNWGELVLNRILEASGLVKGRDFEVQQVLRDEEGNVIKNEQNDKKMIPDVIVHLHDGRDVVIDSKVSLTAFIDYCNAQNEDERKAASKRHVESVKHHYEELAKKDYSAYISSKLGYNIMFIPNEGAFNLVMQEKPGLWSEAFENSVIITTGHTLMAMLRIVELMWQNSKQTRNIEEIVKNAENLIKRIDSLNARYKALGKAIGDLSKKHQELGASITGGQSISVSARKIIELGVKGKIIQPQLNIEEDIENEEDSEQ